MNIEIMRNTLYKAYLDDFAEFCQSLGGATADVMGDLLAFEVGGRDQSAPQNWVFDLGGWVLGVAGAYRIGSNYSGGGYN